MIIAGMLAWLWLEPLPTNDQFAAFWRLCYLACAAGFPIIAWQIGQHRARELLRAHAQNSTGGSHDQNTRRPTRS